MAISATSTISSSTSPSDPYTFNVTVAAGATLFLVMVGLRGGSGSSVLDMKWDGSTGTSFTHIRTDIETSLASQSAIWYLLAPTPGTLQLWIDWATGAPATVSINAIVLSGTDTTAAAIAGNNGTTNTASPISVDVTSATAGSWFFDVMAERGNGVTITQGSESGRTDWSPDWEYEPGGNEAAIGGTKYENTSGTKTFSWTYSGATGALTAVAIKPPSVAGLAKPPYRRHIRFWENKI